MSNTDSTARVTAALTALSEALDALPHNASFNHVVITSGAITAQITMTVKPTTEAAPEKKRLLLLAVSGRDASEWLSRCRYREAEWHRHVVLMSDPDVMFGLKVHEVRATAAALRHGRFPQIWDQARSCVQLEQW